MDEIPEWSALTVLDYTADIGDNRATVRCTAAARDDFDNVKETSVDSVPLSVTATPVPKSGSQDWVIVISVIIPIIFLLLVVIFICWWCAWCCFGGGKDKVKNNKNSMPPVFFVFFQKEDQLEVKTYPQHRVQSSYDNRIANRDDEDVTNYYQNVHLYVKDEEEVRGRRRKGGGEDPVNNFMSRLPWDPWDDRQDDLINYCYEGSERYKGGLKQKRGRL